MKTLLFSDIYTEIKKIFFYVLYAGDSECLIIFLPLLSTLFNNEILQIIFINFYDGYSNKTKLSKCNIGR